MSLSFPPGCEQRPWRRVSSTVQDALLRGDGSPELLRPISTSPTEKELVDAVLSRLKAGGVAFGDLRLSCERQRHVRVSDTSLAGHSAGSSRGIGVRALVKGFWGFSATSDLSLAGVRACADRAVALAKAASAAFPSDLGLNMRDWVEEPAHRAVFHTPTGICPFGASTAELAAPLLGAAEKGLAMPAIKRASAYLHTLGFRRVIANTEGSFIEISHVLMDGSVSFTAVEGGTSASRSMDLTALAGGLEHVIERDFESGAEQAAREARLRCGARKPDAGKYSLILDGQHLGLTMHESVGHPTELDRILGFELSMAGGSFVRPEMLGEFRYGSPIVNLTGDNTLRYGVASRGFDDEGVECQRFPIVENGILAGCGTSRETAHRVGKRRANGTCRAYSWRDVPIVRIPNLHLEPGREKCSLQDLIADTRDGIFMQGTGSFSIDQMRYNFQFGSDMAWRIRDGKLEEPLRDVIYQSITPEFWQSCDAICDASEWQFAGLSNCGKGHPQQTAYMLHGAAPARFRNVTVGF